MDTALLDLVGESHALLDLEEFRPGILRALAETQPVSVATELGLSPRTVQKHLEHAYPKLGVRTRSEAAQVVWAAGWSG